MLDFNYLFKKYGKPNGVIQIGCHFLFTREIYNYWGLNNTIWIEPNPFFFEMNKNIISDKEKIFNYSISTTNYSFSINGEYQEFNSDFKTISQIIEEENIKNDQYDFIHITLQSNFREFDFIKNFKYVSMEITRNVDESMMGYKSIKNKIESFGFKQRELKWIDNIGHIFFTKKRKYQKKLLHLK